MLWSGPDNESDRDWRTNHFVPVMAWNELNVLSPNTLTTENTFDNILTTENTLAGSIGERPRSATSKILIEKDKITLDEENDENISPHIELGTRRAFLEAPLIIKQILNSVREKSFVVEPPKMMTSLSIFIVKFTEENRLSIGKDGDGTWIQDSSRDTHFVLTKK